MREVAVPKADDPVTLRFEPTGAHLIFCFAPLGIVLRAVKLDDEARSQAGKIGDIGPDRHLATKMRSFRSDRAKALP
jgi:hypothetical protein